MRRREFITLVGGAAAWPLGASAQQTDRVRRIGILHPASPSSSWADGIAIFREALAELGHAEGRNVIFVIRWAHGQVSLLPSLANELIESHVDVIITLSALATLAASKGTATIPIVQISGGSPVQSGLAGSLSRPGGNVTGITNQSEDIAAKLLELLFTL